METLIKKLEKRPVSIERLSTAVPKNTKCLLYTDLKAPLFPQGIQCLIILLESKSSEIGHFVLVIKRTNGVEYWSSYGHRPQYAITGCSPQRGSFSFLREGWNLLQKVVVHSSVETRHNLPFSYLLS